MPKSNNFDLIRLAAALQVAFTHAVADLGVTGRYWHVLDFFPGVPIFFFVSGFLIGHSFEKHPVLPDYCRNRALRIYPGMAVCFALALASVWLTGYFSRASAPWSTWVTWITGQLSVGRYNPDFMRQYGVGVLNGSTWTIAIELQFYALVPVLYIAGLRRLTRAQANLLLAALVALFMLANLAYVNLDPERASPLQQLTGVAFVPWFYMFLFGLVCQRNFDVLQRFLAGRFVTVALLYCALALFSSRWLHWRFNNDINPVLFAFLCALVLAAAFSRPTLSDRLLRRNDLSYGAYLYHAPLINLVLVTGVAASAGGVWFVMAGTLVLAYASWRVIEKAALALKRNAAYAHSSDIAR